MDKKLIYHSIEAYLSHYHRFHPKDATEFKVSFFAENSKHPGALIHFMLLTDIEDVENILKYCIDVSGKSLTVEYMVAKFIKDVMTWT